MNKNRLHYIQALLFVLFATSLLAACTQDELSDRGTALPEGKYPLELTSASLGTAATPTTRSTVDGTWNGGESISVQVASSLDYSDKDNIPWGEVPIINYTVSSDGTMTLAEGSNPIYWQTSDETMYIRAWYAGTKGYESVPVSSAPAVVKADWTTATAQNETTMAADDFLYAYKELKFADKAESKIELRHLLSKLTINLVKSSYLETYKADVSVLLTGSNETSTWNIEGIFSGDGSNFVLDEGTNLQSADISPCKLLSPESDTYYATYEALVIPQSTQSGGKVIKVQVGKATYTWAVGLPNSQTKLESGKAYTFNIAVKEHDLEVTFDKNTVWKQDDANGSGSVELP